MPRSWAHETQQDERQGANLGGFEKQLAASNMSLIIQDRT